MTVVAAQAGSVPWWREPTRDQWTAWWKSWLGWTLDSSQENESCGVALGRGGSDQQLA